MIATLEESYDHSRSQFSTLGLLVARPPLDNKRTKVQQRSPGAAPDRAAAQHIQATEQAFAAILDDGSVATWGNPEMGGDSSMVQEQLNDVRRIQATWVSFAVASSRRVANTPHAPESASDSQAPAVSPHGDPGSDVGLSFNMLPKTLPGLREGQPLAALGVHAHGVHKHLFYRGPFPPYIGYAI